MVQVALCWDEWDGSRPEPDPAVVGQYLADAYSAQSVVDVPPRILAWWIESVARFEQAQRDMDEVLRKTVMAAGSLQAQVAAAAERREPDDQPNA